MIFLPHLGVVRNFKKCILEPTQEIEFLDMIANSQTMSLSLPSETVKKIKNQCLEVYKMQDKTVRNINFHHSSNQSSIFSFDICNERANERANTLALSTKSPSKHPRRT